jgi:hypothetical protein
MSARFPVVIVDGLKHQEQNEEHAQSQAETHKKTAQLD